MYYFRCPSTFRHSQMICLGARKSSLPPFLLNILEEIEGNVSYGKFSRFVCSVFSINYYSLQWWKFTLQGLERKQAIKSQVKVRVGAGGVNITPFLCLIKRALNSSLPIHEARFFLDQYQEIKTSRCLEIKNYLGVLCKLLANCSIPQMLSVPQHKDLLSVISAYRVLRITESCELNTLKIGLADKQTGFVGASRNCMRASNFGKVTALLKTLEFHSPWYKHVPTTLSSSYPKPIGMTGLNLS